ncbi:methyltransferase domain-containing protein [Bacillus sp. B190/17]|uniref:Methyltransferase domain-containing protein n=1 Tax=Bacillus lumedeiriae TaxID=3058829 RepID=A0ABW8I9D8_9BACI
MIVTDHKLMTKEDAAEWTIAADSFLHTVRMREGEHILWLGEDASPLLSKIAIEKARVITASPSASPFAEAQFDGVAGQLGIHFWDEGEDWLRKSFDLLKAGGRLVIDLAEEGALRHIEDIAYIKSLPYYWDLLREIGFETIFVQQVTARSTVEAIGQGWTELIETPELPIVVNRFIALKGC